MPSRKNCHFKLLRNSVAAVISLMTVAIGFTASAAPAIASKLKIVPVIFDNMDKPNLTKTKLRNGDNFTPRFYYGDGSEQQLIDKNIMLHGSEMARAILNDKTELASMYLRSEAMIPARPSVVVKAMKSLMMLQDLLISKNDKSEDWAIVKKKLQSVDLAKLRTIDENSAGWSFRKLIPVLGKTLSCDFHIGSMTYDDFQRNFPNEDTAFQRANSTFIATYGKPEFVVLEDVVNFSKEIPGVIGFEMMSFIFPEADGQGSLVVSYQIGGFDRSKLALKKILWVTVATLDGQLKSNVIQPYPGALTREADRLEQMQKKKDGKLLEGGK